MGFVSFHCSFIGYCLPYWIVKFKNHSKVLQFCFLELNSEEQQVRCTQGVRRCFSEEITLSIFHPKRKKSTHGHANRKRRGANSPATVKTSLLYEQSFWCKTGLKSESIETRRYWNTEGIETKKPSIYTMRLSAKLRKLYLHVHWFCCSQLRTTSLRNAVLYKRCPAQEEAGKTEIGSR